MTPPNYFKMDLPNLDVMRSVAVLLVVLTHVRSYMRWQPMPITSIWFLGMLGVFIFFTHTTLVLMWSLERDPHTLRFYVRRAFRLYPLWLAVLALTILIRQPTSPANFPHFIYSPASAKDLVASALLVFNLVPGSNVLIGASWSLPVELQMYLVLPVLFVFARTRHAFTALVALDLLAIAVARRIDPAIASDLLFCTPLFLPGVMAYIGFKKVQPRLPAWTFLLWLGLLVESTNFWASRSLSSFRSGWLFCLLLGLSLPFFHQISFNPLKRMAHLVARYSYGLYLCHMFAITVGLHYLIRFNLAIRLTVAIAALVVMPVLFYHTIEEPMIRVGSRLAKKIEPGPSPRIDDTELSLETVP